MSGKAFRVLLVEGDTNEASLVKRYLGDAPDAGADRFEVVESVRVSTACHALARGDFDAVLLDLQLPQCEGLEGFSRIRAQRPELPIILLTDLADEPLAAQALKRGAQDYLVKGTVDCCLLKRTVRHAVEKKSLTNLVERLLDQEVSAKLIVDGDAVVLYANPAAEALFGVPAQDLTGKPFAFPREAGAVTIISPKSVELSAEMSVTAIEWSGEPARLISFLGAAGAEESAKARLGGAERRRLDDIKALFTRRLSHEMRNTLSTVKTAVFCLKDPPTGPLSVRQARLVDMIARNVDRQVRIFDKLGDLARFQAGKLALDLRPHEVNSLIDEVARESELKTADGQLVVEQAAGLPRIAADADMLLQVVRSLLDNAFRHAKAKVSIKTFAEGSGGVRIVVGDDGPGIPKNRQAELFTPFAELDKRKDAPGFNGGLGLTICREIVEGHGGRIWAESDASGSRFSFTLPAYTPSEREDARESRIFVSHSRSRPTYAGTGAASKERP